MSHYRRNIPIKTEYGMKKIYVEEDFSMAKNIYYMYLAGFLTFYISNIIGYMKALNQRKNPDASTIMKSHYRYQVKIMHINMLINVVCILGTLAYIFYIISGMDFMNIDLNNDLTLPFASTITFWTISSIANTLLFYIQTSFGLKKILNKQQI